MAKCNPVFIVTMPSEKVREEAGGGGGRRWGERTSVSVGSYLRNTELYLTSRFSPDFVRSVYSQCVFTGLQLNRKHKLISLSWFRPRRLLNVKKSEHLKTAISLNTVMISAWIVVTLSGEWDLWMILLYEWLILLSLHKSYVQQRHLEVRSVWFYRPEVFFILLFLTSHVLWLLMCIFSS